MGNRNWGNGLSEFWGYVNLGNKGSKGSMELWSDEVRGYLVAK